MKNKKAIINKMNTCLLEGKYEEVRTLESALSIFGMSPWYGDNGMVVKIIEVIQCFLMKNKKGVQNENKQKRNKI